SEPFAAELSIGAVVDDAVAVVVEKIALFGARLPRRAIVRHAARSVAAAPSLAARRSRPLVDHAVAVVVDEVAHLGGARKDLRVVVVAVAVARAEALRVARAAHPRRAVLDAVTVAVLVLAHHDGRKTLVDDAVAVVVFAVANFHRAGVNGGIVVVAVALRERVVGRLRAGHRPAIVDDAE